MNAGSNIGNGNLDHRVVEGLRRQGDLPRFLIGHRLKCIADEIDNNLLDLNPVHPYFRGLGIEFKPQTQRQRSDAIQYKGAASSIIEGSSSIRLSVSPLLTNWRRLRTISLASNACSEASSVTSSAVSILTCPPRASSRFAALTELTTAVSGWLISWARAAAMLGAV